MEASFVDLRKKSSQVIRALRRNERVTVLYRGKPVAVMHPINEADQTTKAADQAGFGVWGDRRDMADPSQYVRKLRGPRYRDL